MTPLHWREGFAGWRAQGYTLFREMNTWSIHLVSGEHSGLLERHLATLQQAKDAAERDYEARHPVKRI